MSVSREFWACSACDKPRWAPGEDEDDEDPDYIPNAAVGDIDDEDMQDDDPAEMRSEVQALVLEAEMPMAGVLLRQNIPIDDLLALYGKEETSDDSPDEDAGQDAGGEASGAEGREACRLSAAGERDGGVIPYYPSLRYAVAQKAKQR